VTTELCVCALPAQHEQSTVNYQLRVLCTSRLMTYRKVARITYYRLTNRHVTNLLIGAPAYPQGEITSVLNRSCGRMPRPG
jgi:ArsR family transcriptional regulator, lead/cadmium/zinc/bismuth-responsive transcriptional repressor